MAYGAIARDPATPYLVYAFVWRGKVFYVGLAQARSTRHTHRWSFVANLLRHERAGTLKEDKRRELVRKSNAVLAELQRAGLEKHEVHVLWEGIGRAACEVEEARHIREHLAAGCVLANVSGGGGASVRDVLAYLGARREA